MRSIFEDNGADRITPREPAHRRLVPVNIRRILFIEQYLISRTEIRKPWRPDFQRWLREDAQSRCLDARPINQRDRCCPCLDRGRNCIRRRACDRISRIVKLQAGAVCWLRFANSFITRGGGCIGPEGLRVGVRKKADKRWWPRHCIPLGQV